MGRTLFVLTLLIICCEPVFGGVVNGGGGKGVKCGHKIETLDLFEAKLMGWPKPIDEGSFRNNLYIYGTDYLVYMAESIEELTGEIDSDKVLAFFKDHILLKIVDIPQGQRLPLTNDATLPQLPPDCVVVQLAVYSYVEDKIYRDLEYWNRLSNLDKTALTLHEIFYYRARMSGGATNSDEVRNVVGRLMTKQEANPLFSPIWFDSHLECVAGFDKEENVYEFFITDAYRKEGHGIGLYFAAINNRYLISHTTAFVQDLSMKKILSLDFPPQTFKVKNHITGESWDLTLTLEKLPPPEKPLLIIKETEGTKKRAAGFCQYVRR